MTDEVIVAEGLTRRFGDFTAVDQVTFSMQAGEVVGYLGPNGSGKTTTIRMLGGILSPTSGGIRIAGLGGRTDAGRQVGAEEFLPQGPQQFAVDASTVLETHFQFCRMHVHIDILARQIEEQRKHRVSVPREHIRIGTAYRANQ